MSPPSIRRTAKPPAGLGGGARPVTLAALERDVVACQRCPRLRAHCAEVARTRKREFRTWEYWERPVPGFGDPRARLLIVGLAPAAHGATRTGRMFTGDSSGQWLYEALHRFGFANQPTSVHRDDGLQLRDCYITAAARCAPPGNRPALQELQNCRPYLEAELRILTRVRVILALGHIAHRQWLEASGQWELPSRERPRFRHGAVAPLPNDRTLVCSYHPSRQNTNTGRLTKRMWYGVFRNVRRLLGERGGAGWCGEAVSRAP